MGTARRGGLITFGLCGKVCAQVGEESMDAGRHGRRLFWLGMTTSVPQTTVVECAELQ